MSWPQPALSGYNATPPSDDGAQTASNVVALATILAKIGNPLKTLLEATIGTLPAYLVPTGAVMPFAGAAAPAGWLLCYGQPVSRSTYADLFAAIGTTYGIGDGSTTFNVPDLRGRAVFGKDDMGGTAASRITAGVSGINGASLGAAGGDERLHAHSHTGTVSVNDPTHTHGQSPHGHGVTDPTHGHTGASAGSVTVGTDSKPPGNSTGAQTGTFAVNNAATGISIQSATAVNIAAATGISATTTINNSGGGASQNMPPALVANWIVKT